MKKLLLSFGCLLAAIQFVSAQGTFTPSKVRTTFDLAYSYRVGEIDESIQGATRDFINRMRSGVAYGATCHGFPNRFVGVGAKLYGHHYSRSEGGFTDAMNTVYIGPSAMARIITRDKKGAWVFGLSFGYVHYFEKWEFSGHGYNYGGSYDTDAPGFGFYGDAGYDIRIGPKTYFGFKVSLHTAAAFVTSDNAEDLSAIEIGCGIRF